MEPSIIKKNIWNSAGYAGLALGVLSSAVLMINQFVNTTEINSFISLLVSFLLWTVRFCGSIWIMWMFMTRFVKNNQGAVNSDTFKMGIATALLSALIYAAMNFANTAYISAESIAEEMDMVMKQMAPMMDSNSSDMIDKMMENMPQIAFFSNLIYCFLYGTILSFILSRYIPSKNPFSDHKIEEQ